MKVIDLLVAISKGEEIPKIIKYNGMIWIYDNGILDYRNEDKDSTNEFLLYSMNTLGLNTSVEIIEEPKKIEKIPISYKNHTHRLRRIEKKLNEIINYINNMEK